MKGKLSVFFLTTVAFLLIVISVPAPIIIPQQGGGGSTVSGSITGAYSFNGGLSTINATNVYLAPAISNLVLNLAITNVGASNRVLMSASETRITNAFKRFYFDTNVAHVLSNLVASASSGDVVELGAGDFRIGTQTIRPPVGVTLRGQGMGVTRIIGDVGVATNSIVQLMSTNIIEDLTVIAGKKSLSTFQYPIANLMIFGHPACTNVILRRVEIDGETDCLLISQTNSTSGTIEDSWFHSAWDVCNILDLDDGNAAPGANWTIRRTRLYADSATAQNPQGVANPKSQPFIAAGAIVNLINCELTATNHKAITIILQGFETNLISIFDGTLQSAGTNGFGKQVDITTDSDNSVSTVKVSGTLINDTALAGSTVVYYEPRQVSTLYTSGIKFVNGFASNSFLYLKADTNVAAATFGSGLTFSGGTLTASAGSSNFITTAHGSAYVTNSVTAGSFIGSGTGVPILKLQTMMSADNALALSVRTNFTQTATNFFEFTSPSAGQAMVLHSASAGQLVWTNATAAGGGFAALEVQTNGVRAGLVTNVNFANGFTGSVSGSTITIAEYRTGATIGEVSVLDYGADRTGAADSTTAFQAAATNPAVFIPAGTYMLTNVIVTNASIRGIAGKSILRFNTNVVPSGYMFDTAANLTHWRGITFDGGCTTNQRTFSISGVARSGIKLYIGGSSTIMDCQFMNFQSNAVYAAGLNDISGRPNQFRFQNNLLTNNWRGLWLPSPNFGEYSIITDNNWNLNYIALKNDCANVTVSGNSFHDNSYSVACYDTTAGRSHSVYTGNTFHHTALSWQNALTTATITGNNMMGTPTIELLAPCFGVNFRGNTMESPTFSDYSGGTNLISGNSIYGTISQSGTSTSIFRDNVTALTGVPVSETVALAYVSTNLHIRPFRGDTFNIILTQNSGFTIEPGGEAQRIKLRLTQDGTGSRTAQYTNAINFSTTYPKPTLSTGIGKTDWLELQYWSASNRWDVINIGLGN